MHYEFVGDPYCWSHPTPDVPREPARSMSLASVRSGLDAVAARTISGGREA